MEDQHDVEGSKLIAGDGQCQTDENRVEDDTELEDEQGGHLSGVILAEDTGSLFLHFGPSSSHLVVDVRASMAEVVVTTGVRSRGAVGCTRADTRRQLERRLGLVDSLGLLAISKRLRLDTQVIVVLKLVIVSVTVAVAKLGISHCHKLDKEQHEYCHQDNTLDPTVVLDGSSETLIVQCFMGRCE